MGIDSAGLQVRCARTAVRLPAAKFLNPCRPVSIRGRL